MGGRDVELVGRGAPNLTALVEAGELTPLAAEPIPEDDPPPDHWQREGDRPGAYLPPGNEPPPFDPEDPGAGAEGEAAGGSTSDGGEALRRQAAALPWLHPTVDWFTEEPPRRKYLLHFPATGQALGDRGPGLLPRGKVGILAAGGGVGKTFALCGLALAVATGRRWLGYFPVGAAEGERPRRVAFIAGEEDAGELRRRLYNQARIMGLGAEDLDRAAAGILALPAAGCDNMTLTVAKEEGGGSTGFADSLLAYLEAEAGEGWDVVLLDPLSRFAGPDVETDNIAATRLIQTLERLTKLPGDPAVLVAHHTTKGARRGGEGARDETGVRGSSALVDGARWVGNLTRRKVIGRDDITGYSTLEVTKNNYGPPFGRGVLLRAPPEDHGGVRAATEAEATALAEAEQATKDAAAEQRRKEPRPPGPRAGGKGGKAAEVTDGRRRGGEPDLT